MDIYINGIYIIKKIAKIININKCTLIHIIGRNNKYIIIADYINKSFEIIKLDKKII